MRPFFVYLLRCADGSYYAGHTDDLERRIAQHQAGEMGGYTHDRRPLTLAWSQETAGRDEALAAELRIKGWSRAKKEALIEGDWERLSALARARGEGLRQAQPERGEVLGASSAVMLEPQPQPQPQPQQPQSVRTELVEVQPSTPTPIRAELVEALHRDMQSDGPSQRRAIAKAITLLESTRADHRQQADELLTALLPHTGNAFRLGISGVPGVGKSTFIEALGLHLIAAGHRVAVLTIDPSSTISGGSILGDKTRMERLSMHERAYIRPSPSSGTLGGVAEKTREAMLVCEAAGYDIVIVETVGVGQSEIAVAGMTDCFVLMQLPNAGDDLQAIKKGVVEIADLVLINKADIDAAAAQRAEAHISSALRLFGPHSRHGGGDIWQPRVLRLAALRGEGVTAFWDAVGDFRQLRAASGALAQRRQQQSLAWMWERIDAGLKQAFRTHPAVRAQLPALLQDVAAGRVAPSNAARNMLAAQAGIAQAATENIASNR